jgi:hypothetical protein
MAPQLLIVITLDGRNSNKEDVQILLASCIALCTKANAYANMREHVRTQAVNTRTGN